MHFPTSAVLGSLLALGANAHGFLSIPAARNLKAAGSSDVGYGLTNPGAGTCDISISNQMNNNGCQGAVGVVDFQTPCYTTCLNDLTSKTDACVKCKADYVAKFIADHASSGAVGGTLREGGHTGICGDAFWNRANKKDAFALGREDAAKDESCGGKSCTDLAMKAGPSMMSVAEDGTFDVEMTITAHHWGWSEFRLCEHGGYGENDNGLTQECFNEHVLSFDVKDAEKRYPPSAMGKGQGGAGGISSPTDYNKTPPSVRCSGSNVGSGANPVPVKEEFPSLWAPEGSCCNKGGDCGKPEDNAVNATRWVFPAPIGKTEAGGEQGKVIMHGVYQVKLRMPEDVECSAKSPCTLQWLFMTGNSPDSYPEAFRNCADFAVVDSTPALIDASVASRVRSKLSGGRSTWFD